MKIRNIVLIFTLILINYSCKKEVIDLSKKSDILIFEKSLVGPLVIGSFLLSDLIDDYDDSDEEILVVDGDTVKLHILRDSLLIYNTSDIVIIPRQATIPYYISPVGDVDITSYPNDFIVDELITDTTYRLVLQNSMRLDSLFLNSGLLNIEVINSFDYDIDLIISSDSITDSNNNDLNESIAVAANSSASSSIDLTGYKVIFGHTATAATTVNIVLTPRFHKNGGTAPLSDFDNIDVDIDVSDLNDFEIVYGFMGYQSASFDTISNVIIEGMEEELNHISGTFQATNPKIWLNYQQSFGVPISADLYMDIYHHDAADAVIDFEPKIIPSQANPGDLPLTGSLLFSSTDNIDELLTFPVPDSTHIIGDIITNRDMDSVTTKNFVTHNSEMMLGLDIEVPLEFRADLTYYDTLELGLTENLDKDNEYEFEVFNLNSYFTNSFPIGFDGLLFLYNEEIDQVIDSIDLNSIPGKPFITAAPVDANGIVILSEVKEEKGVIALDELTANNLLTEATHLIIRVKIQTTDLNSVKVLQTSKLDFQFTIVAKGTVIKKL